jgi:WD40 repeat protein
VGYVSVFLSAFVSGFHTFSSLEFNRETIETIMSFEKQPLGISGIAWMDWAAGNFISTNGRNNHLKMWNASQKTALKSIKIPHNSSIMGISLNSSQKKSLLSYSDGTICVFDLDTNRVDYKSQPGNEKNIVF